MGVHYYCVTQSLITKHRNARVLKSVICSYFGLKITPDSANRWEVGWALVHVHGTSSTLNMNWASVCAVLYCPFVF